MGEVGRLQRGPLSSLRPVSRREDPTTKALVHSPEEKEVGERSSLGGKIGGKGREANEAIK